MKAKITSKGQLPLPKPSRDKLGLKSGYDNLKAIKNFIQKVPLGIRPP